MASNFDRWEKDPFFPAAEEVQQSADRMESTYRTWIHSLKDLSGLWNPKELRRDLHTAFGTTKWQLEEFERAVKSSYTNSSAEDARVRHQEFIIAIKNQISRVEKSLHESAVLAGNPPRPWVHLNEGECDELATFLSGISASSGKTSAKTNASDLHMENPLKAEEQSTEECIELPGHRRAASASPDIGAWKIAVADDVLPQSFSHVQHKTVPQKIPSFSGFLNALDSAAKFKWPNNGYRKLKLTDFHEEADTTTLQTQNLSRGICACYERSKNCLDGCNDCYDKQLYGWYGAIQRQFQRSQYHMQYSRPVRVILWIALIFCLIVVFGFCAI